jgi:GntR family transcriptional regulator, carbon starvation induced regulator
MKRSVASVSKPVESEEAPRTLAESIYRRLRQDILWGVLAPGEPLRSDELRSGYAVGISPLREALSRLLAERLVTAVGQRGFRVAPLIIADVIDTMETRLVIEREALARSIQLGDVAWETGIVATFHALSRIPIPKRPGSQAEIWASHHRQYHRALLAACGSRWLVELSGLLFDQAERHRILRARIGPLPKLTRDVAAEHKQIFDAVIGRNVRKAVRALDRHYRTTSEQIVAVLKCTPKLV